MATKTIVSIVTDFEDVEDFLVANGFEFFSTGCGSFEYVTAAKVDVEALSRKLAEMLVRVAEREMDE